MRLERPIVVTRDAQWIVPGPDAPTARASEPEVRQEGTIATLDREWWARASSEYPVRRWWGVEILDHAAAAVDLGRIAPRGPLLVGHWGEEPVGRIMLAELDEEARTLRLLSRFGDNANAREINRSVRDGTFRNVSIAYEILDMVLERQVEDGPDEYRVTGWRPVHLAIVPQGADPTAYFDGPLPQPSDTERAPRGAVLDSDRAAVAELLAGVRAAGGSRTAAPAATVITTEQTAMPREQDRHDNAARDADDAGTETGTETVVETRSAPGAALDSSAREAITLAVREADVARVEAIRARAALWPNLEAVQVAATDAIRDGTSAEDFRNAALELARSAPGAVDQGRPVSEIGLSAREQSDYRLFRALDALVESRSTGRDPRALAPLEFEAHDAIAERLEREHPDREVRGVLVPFEIQSAAGWVPRAASIQMAVRGGLLAPGAGAALMGGLALRAPPMDTTENVHLVGTDHLASNYIDALRAVTLVYQAGATPLPGLVGNVDIPGQTGDGSFGWVDEDGDSSDTEVPTKTVSLTPRTVTGSFPITRRLLKQSAPPVEEIVRRSAVFGVALAIDDGAINGTGASGQPLGIVNQTGVNVITMGTPGSPTWAEIVDFETQVANQNGLSGSPSFLVSPGVRGHCKVTPRHATASAVGFIHADDDTMNGYPVRAGTALNVPHIVFGDYSNVLIGMWGVLDVNPDTATEASKGRLTLRFFQDVDVGVRHGAAFAKSATV